MKFSTVSKAERSLVGTLWSTVVSVQSGRRTGRPAVRSPCQISIRGEVELFSTIGVGTCATAGIVQLTAILLLKRGPWRRFSSPASELVALKNCGYGDKWKQMERNGNISFAKIRGRLVAGARTSKACGEVTSCTMWRSMYISSVPSSCVSTTWSASHGRTPLPVDSSTKQQPRLPTRAITLTTSGDKVPTPATDAPEGIQVSWGDAHPAVRILSYMVCEAAVTTFRRRCPAVTVAWAEERSLDATDLRLLRGRARHAPWEAAAADIVAGYTPVDEVRSRGEGRPGGGREWGLVMRAWGGDRTKLRRCGYFSTPRVKSQQQKQITKFPGGGFLWGCPVSCGVASTKFRVRR